MTTPNFPNSGFIQIFGGAAPPNTPPSLRPCMSGRLVQDKTLVFQLQIVV